MPFRVVKNQQKNCYAIKTVQHYCCVHYVPEVTKNRFLHFGKYTFKQLFSNIHKFLEIKPKELTLYYEK